MAFPTTALSITVQIYYSGGWHDITSYVYRANESPIRVQRGYSDPASQLSYGTAEFLINNIDGRFSPRNPNSALYGLIGRNTPVWITVDGTWRFVGRIPAWPSEWGAGGFDVWVPVTAAGVVRSLQMGAPSLRSAMYRAMHAQSNTLTYWPMEDGVGAESFGSDVDGGRAMVYRGAAPAFANDTSFACSDSLPTLAATSLRATIPSHTPTNEFQIIFLLKVPEAGLANNTEILDIRTNGTYDHYKLKYATGGGLYLQVINDTTSGYTTVETTGTSAFAINGATTALSVKLESAGGNTAYEISRYTVGDSAVGAVNGVFGVAQEINQATSIVFAQGTAMTDCVIGHVWTTDTPISSVSLGYLALAVNAYAGDAPDTRMTRLCAEAGIIYTGGGASEATLGTQGIDTLYNAIMEIADVSGMVYESRDSSIGLTYKTGVQLYNQASALTIAYTDGVISDMSPTEDDTLLQNDVTVRRKDGASFRKVITDGPMGTAEAGTYEAGKDLSLHTDEQARNHAGWRAHLGTIDEARYPNVTLDLALVARDLPGSLAAAKALDVTSVIRITGLPAWLPANSVDLFVIGYSEEFWQFGWRLNLTCVPAQLWDAFVLGDGEYGRLQPTSATLAAGVTAGATSWSVASSGAVFTTSAGDLPMSCMCEGEEVTVTAIAGASSPQTFTVTRSVNGVSKAHSLGAAVTLKAATPLGV